MQAFTKYNIRYTEVIEVMIWKTFSLKSQDYAWNEIGQSISWHSTQDYRSQQSPLGIEKIRYQQYKHWKRYVLVLVLPYLNFLRWTMMQYP